MRKEKSRLKKKMNKDIVKQAIEILNSGGVIIYPTDTAYAIGCRIDKNDSVKRLFEIKKRSKTQAVPVLVDGIKMAQNYLDPIPDQIQRLMQEYWPGQLTIVLPCRKDKVSDLVRGGGSTLGVRMPNHSVALKIIKKIGVPILGPSANFSSEKTPYSFNQLDKDLIKFVDLVLPSGNLGREASTVIDCSVEPWKVLRQGTVKVQNSGKVVLFIDAGSSARILVGLEINGKKHIEEREGSRKAQIVLSMINDILKKYNIDRRNLDEIKVNIGPGSFTGLRVGVSIANALGFSLGIKINGKKIGELVEPEY